jgi:hypothetical protein
VLRICKGFRPVENPPGLLHPGGCLLDFRVCSHEIVQSFQRLLCQRKYLLSEFDKSGLQGPISECLHSCAIDFA